MYAKLFSRITESSLMEESVEVRYVFMVLLAISDRTGHVVGTDVALARRLNMPLADFQRCIQALKAPDPDSNSKEEDGRRVIESEGERGYRLVNYTKYRDLKNEDGRREYMRTYMANRRAKPASGANGKQPLALLTHADADGDREAKESTPSGAGKARASSVKKKPADPAEEQIQAEFMRLWQEAYRKVHGRDYAISKGRDWKAAHELCTSAGKAPKELVEIAAAAWVKVTDRFHSAKAKTVHGFAECFNEIAATVDRINGVKPTATPGASPFKGVLTI